MRGQQHTDGVPQKEHRRPAGQQHALSQEGCFVLHLLFQVINLHDSD